MTEHNSEKPVKKLYRIGEFSKYLGVTPDFLKHYEQNELIRSEAADNGYRYFAFGESSKIFECLKLKNYGFTVREMNKMLNDMEPDDIFNEINVKAGEMRKRIAFEQELLKHYDEFSEFYTRMQGKATDWSIGYSEPLLFLPHSSGRDFTDDERVYELLNSWVEWLPISYSAMTVRPTDPDDPEHSWNSGNIWGFAMPSRIAEAYNLPVNDVVTEFPERKCLFFDYADADTLPNNPDNPYRLLYKELNRLNLAPAGPILMLSYMNTRINSSPRRFGRFIVPI